jgi:hypothetical protein
MHNHHEPKIRYLEFVRMFVFVSDWRRATFRGVPDSSNSSKGARLRGSARYRSRAHVGGLAPLPTTASSPRRDRAARRLAPPRRIVFARRGAPRGRSQARPAEFARKRARRARRGAPGTRRRHDPRFPCIESSSAPCAARRGKIRRTTPSHNGGCQRSLRRGSSDVRKRRAWWHRPVELCEGRNG